MNTDLYNSILIALNDSMSSRAAVEYVSMLPLRAEEINITLLHVLRKPSGGEELMGEKFMKEQPERRMAVLQKAKDKLAENGFSPDRIQINLVDTQYPTVADGIIDQFEKGRYNMVVIGRKKMSKAEEFVLGDPSIKLVRQLDRTSVMVIKS